MSKVNHHSIKYKMQHPPNKKYKDLKQKQKAKIADWMFLETNRFLWVPYEELLKEYIKKLPRYAERVKEKGVTETVEEKKEKPVVKTAIGEERKLKH